MQKPTFRFPIAMLALLVSGAAVAAPPTLFEYGACERRSDMCPLDASGVAVFDAARFRAMYISPDSEPSFYPPTTTGSALFLRTALPMCEDHADTVDTTDPDPITWMCAASGKPAIRCTDGTRPVAYFREAADPSSTKWMITPSGGGADPLTDETSIEGYMGTKRGRFTSVGSPARKGYEGLLNDAAFDDYHRVRIELCAGGRAMGQSEELDGTVTKFHHGLRITKAVFALIEARALETGSSPTQVVIQTQSNGGWGGILTIDHMRDDLIARFGPIDVRLNAHSLLVPTPEVEKAAEACAASACAGMSPGEQLLAHRQPAYADNEGVVYAPDSTDRNVICAGKPNPNDVRVDACANAIDEGVNGATFSTDTFGLLGGLEYQNIAVFGTPLDESCASVHENPAPCRDPMHVLLFHLQTPVFVSAQTHDANLRTSRLHSFIGTDSSINYGYHNDDFRYRVLALTEALTLADGHKDSTELPGHSAFVTNAAGKGDPSSHWGATHDLKWDMMLDNGLGNLSHREVFRAWLDAATPYAPNCRVDDPPIQVTSGNLPCQTQPDSIECLTKAGQAIATVSHTDCHLP